MGPLRTRPDVHEYLDKALIQHGGDANFDLNAKGSEFLLPSKYINDALGVAFKRWNGVTIHWKFLMSVFEVMSKGVSENLPSFDQGMDEQARKNFILNAAKNLRRNDTFHSKLWRRCTR